MSVPFQIESGRTQPEWEFLHPARPVPMRHAVRLGDQDCVVTRRAGATSATGDADAPNLLNWQIYPVTNERAAPVGLCESRRRAKL
jgi:hypothetical protein